MTTLEKIETIKREAKKEELTKKYNNLNEAIKGYINDSKLYGFKPTELKDMQGRAANLMEQILKLK